MNDSWSDLVVLQINDLLEKSGEEMLRQEFNVLRLPKRDYASFLAEHGARIRAIAGTGKGPLDADMLKAMPNAEIFSSFSAGLEGVDVKACASHGVKIANTSHILAEDVADIALGLLISVCRDFPRARQFMASGAWHTGPLPLGRSLKGLKVGIIGLGHIGKEIARRLEVVGAKVAYHGPNEKRDVDLPYHAEVGSLADWADALIVSCPETPETYHLVNADVLARLGREGIVVNIARGSIIDEAALIAALQENRIAGAGLDVFEHEPNVPDALLRDERVTVLPHIGSATVETRRRMGEAMVEAIKRHFQSGS